MSRKYIGWLCLLVGAFLLTTAAVAKFWGEPNSQRTPLNTDSTTYLSGTAKVLNVATGKTETSPVKIVSYTKVDPKHSTGKIAVFTSGTCVMKDVDNPPPCGSSNDDRLISASNEVLAADRHTAESVNTFKGKPSGYSDIEGLVLKYPFNTQKKTYLLWNDTADKQFPAKYVGEANTDGVKTYKFQTDISGAPIEIAKGVKGTYDYTMTQWVDPVTGSVLAQKQHDVRTLTDGTTALDMSVAYTPATVKSNAHDAKGNITSLHLVSRVLPIGGLIGGIVLIGLGLVLAIGGGARREEESREKESAHA